METLPGFVAGFACQQDGFGKIQADFAGRMGVGTERDRHILGFCELKNFVSRVRIESLSDETSHG